MPAATIGRATKAGTKRASASTDISSTASRATGVKTSEWLTQAMMIVDCATTIVSSRTSTTVGASAKDTAVHPSGI